MAKVIQHLATAPSKGYTIFEDNQVLTEAPLNRLADYFDDQERLTRVSLLGVGIFCGLRLTIDGEGGVTLSKGVAVTTDGDLLRAAEDLTYTRFRTYGTEAPKYDPFYDGANMRPVFQLIGEDEDPAAAKIDDFGTQTGQKLTDLIGVLLMESFQKDADLCTGGDCDNKGKDALANVKLLLMAPADVAALRESLPTFSNASAQIPPAYASRVVLNASIDSAKKLAAAYRAAAAVTRGRLLEALKTVLAVCRPFFDDVFAKDPLADWTTKLNAAHPDSAAEQYFDHLRDVVDACNALGAVLAGDTAVCCPPQAAFPKHVLLGAVGTAPLDLDANRTGCYPSPLVASRQTFDRARFMLRRIDTLIMGFAQIPQKLPVTITPSRTDDRPLDERAIPAYYPPPATNWPIHRAWSYELERRGLAEYNYSASTALELFTPKGPAIEPLVASLAAATFLRIEGHVGGGVQDAMNTINSAITKANLPFAVRSVLLDTDRTKIRVRPGMRYNDLNRFHELLRHDLARQIDDIKVQTINYHGDLTAAVTSNVLPDNVLGDGVLITNTAKRAMDKVSASADVAVAGLDKKYTEYRATPWKQNVDVVVEQSASMRMTLGDVTKAELAWPVDSLYSTWKPTWPVWLDKIIDDKNDDEDDKLLFKNFIASHPAAEHLGGVARGGTFVLIYIDGGTVVGDVTLPYYWPEDAEPEPAPRPLPTPPTPPITKTPWRVREPWDVKWKVDLDRFKKVELEPFKQLTLQFPETYFNALKQSTEILQKYATPPTQPGPRTATFADKQLGALVESMLDKSQSLVRQRQLLLDPALDAAKQKEITTGIKKQEAELVDAIAEVGRVVTGPTVNTATDGATAVSLMADVTSVLSGKSATTVATKLKETLEPATVKVEMKNMMGGMLKGLQL
jgi:hypothetical protein